MQQNLPNTGISLQNTRPVVCEECENATFREAVLIRKAPGVLIGSSKDAVIPIPVFECSKCSHVSPLFFYKTYLYIWTFSLGKVVTLVVQ